MSLVLILALGLTGLSAGALFFRPNIIENPWLWLLPGLWFSLLVLGNACGFLHCVLRSALAGEVSLARGPGWNLPEMATCAATWLICFVAGPALLAGIAFYLWLEGGRLSPGDWAIVAELAVAATAHFLFTLLAVTRSNSLRDANPIRVVELVHHLGVKGGGIVMLASLLAVVHGGLFVEAVTAFPRNPTFNFLLLAVCWTSGMFLATFFLRWLGLTCYWKKGT